MVLFAFPFYSHSSPPLSLAPTLFSLEPYTMRFFALVPVLAALTTAVAGLSLARDDGCGNSEMGCVAPTKRDFPEQPVARSVGQMTNAELLRRGLPLKAPVMRRGTPVRRNVPSGAPPPQTTTHTGVIRAMNTDGTIFGYLSKSFTGGLGWVPSTDPSNALTVSFVTTDPSGSGSQLDLLTQNQDAVNGEHFSRLGLVQGRDSTSDNLAPGSFNYLYITGTESTPAGSPPVSNVPNAFDTVIDRDTESAVWSYDPSTQALTIHWKNGDGTFPTVKVFAQSNVFYAGADSGAFHSRFPAPVTDLTLKFVPM
jgi:hypothetical protein